MPVFAIIASQDGPGVQLKIQGKIQSQDYYQVDDNTWLVDAPESIVTPKEMSEFLGLSAGAVGRVIIFHVTTYFGYHKRDVWDWLSIKGV